MDSQLKDFINMDMIITYHVDNTYSNTLLNIRDEYSITVPYILWDIKINDLIVYDVYKTKCMDLIFTEFNYSSENSNNCFTECVIKAISTIINNLLIDKYNKHVKNIVNLFYKMNKDFYIEKGLYNKLVYDDIVKESQSRCMINTGFSKNEIHNTVSTVIAFYKLKM
jgi:hypothetical protein